MSLVPRGIMVTRQEPKTKITHEAEINIPTLNDCSCSPSVSFLYVALCVDRSF